MTIIIITYLTALLPRVTCCTNIWNVDTRVCSSQNQLGKSLHHVLTPSCGRLLKGA